MTGARGKVVLAAVVAIALLASCSSGSSSGRAEVGAVQHLSGNQLRYGASPVQHGPITYQPDVVFLGGGADSVHAVSADGLLWTIDGRAARAAGVVPGKILFATSLGAGRVLGVDQVGSDERVALGPVALTDIIEKGSFATTAPVALHGFHAYATPSQPGLETATDPAGGTRATTDAAGSWTAAPIRLVAATTPPSVPALPPLPAPSADVPDSQVGNWNLQSVCCTSIGVHVGYDHGGARVQGTASMGFHQPGVTFSVSIARGHVLDASAQLHGAAELSFGISAAVRASSADFHGGRIQVPVDIAIPIPVAGLPVTVGIQQIFSVSLGLSGEAALSTSGSYALGGSLGFSVHNGVPAVDTPTLTTTKSALDSVQSLAVAPSALTFSYAVKVSIGVGPPGLSVGIWYKVAASLGLVTSGSQIDQLQGTSLVTCKRVTLSVQGTFGVGYRIPSLVASALNLFMRAVMSKPPLPIQPEGGPSWGPSSLFDKSTPPCSK